MHMYTLILCTTINLNNTTSDPAPLPWSAIELLLRPCLLVSVQPTGAEVEGEEEVEHLHRGGVQEERRQGLTMMTITAMLTPPSTVT